MRAIVELRRAGPLRDGSFPAVLPSAGNSRLSPLLAVADFFSFAFHAELTRSRHPDAWQTSLARGGDLFRLPNLAAPRGFFSVPETPTPQWKNPS
jgi:hypothetical protein